jgi:hypothetical protein
MDASTLGACLLGLVVVTAILLRALPPSRRARRRRGRPGDGPPAP